MKVLRHDFNAPLSYYGVGVGPNEEAPEVGERIIVRDHSSEFQVKGTVKEIKVGHDPQWKFCMLEAVSEVEYL